MRRIKVAALVGVLSLVFALESVPAMGADEQNVTLQIDVSAKQFSYTPNRIRVNRGDHVVINFATEDVMHGFHLEGYDIDLKAWAGQVQTAEFVATRAGKFRYRCSQTCGPMHPFMVGELIVEPNYLYTASLILTALTALGSLVYLWIRKEKML